MKYICNQLYNKGIRRIFPYIPLKNLCIHKKSIISPQTLHISVTKQKLPILPACSFY